MSTKELNAYKKEIEDAFGKCTILVSQRDHLVKNTGNTADRKAHNGHYWIEYWQAMTGNHEHRLVCSSCGKEIFVGQPTIADYVDFKDGVDKHKAHGGHIWVVAPQDAGYTGGRYITPLCPFCNGQHDKQININKDAKYCKELGAEKK